MTSRRSHRPDENETETEVFDKQTAVADASAASAKGPSEDEQRQSRLRDRKQDLSQRLGAMADELNKLQHADYDVPIANALKAVEQARIALQAPASPNPQQPVPADVAQQNNPAAPVTL